MAPSHIDLDRHARLVGRRWEAVARRVAVGVLLAFCLMGLANVFGQEPVTSTARGAGADLRVEAPNRLRGGLMAQMRIAVHARAPIRAPRIVLADGVVEDVAINTITPDPDGQRHMPGGRIALEYPPLGAGDDLLVRLQLQVNPLNIGIRDQDVAVWDGARPLADVERRLIVFP